MSCSRWRRGLIDGLTVDGETLLLHTGEGAELRLRGGRLVPGRGYSTAPPSVRRELARVATMLRLRERGRFHMHAAGAVASDGRAWLLAGESGSGKSTLAYALARANWPVLGDDGVLLEHTASGMLAHPWHEPLQVSIELSSEFPELDEYVTAVDWSDPRHRAPVAAPGGIARVAPVGALVLVRRSARDALTPASPTEALTALIRQSPTVLLDDAHAAPQLAVFTALVASVPVFHLEHTPRQLHLISRTLMESAC